MSHVDEKQIAAQVQAVNQISQYFYKKGEVQGFDSLSVQDAPQVLKSLFDSAGMNGHADICHAIDYGITQYKMRHGGDAPSAHTITSALYAAQQQMKTVDASVFDAIDNLNHESNTIVQALPVVTIASMIATANPAVTMIPNLNGANLVPIVAARYVANNTIGAITEGDYIDGNKAALPYTLGRMKFALAQVAATAEYTVVSHLAYADFDLKTPDLTSPLAPFLPNQVSIRVLGIDVANSIQRREDDRKGTYTLVPNDKGIEIAGTTYKVVASTVDFDNQSISVTFDAVLPAGVKAYAHIALDYERKDASKKDRLLPLAGVTLKPEYGQLLASTVEFGMDANINTLTQLSNELNVGLLPAGLSILQSKFYLEQNTALLAEGRDRAIAQGRVSTFDASRGASGNLAAVYNTTGELIGEMIKQIALAQLQIRQAAGGATVGYDLYVGDSGAIFFSCMSSDHFKPTNTPLAGHNEIVRIGTLNNGTNVYHSPNSNGLIAEAANTSQAVLVGRGNEPVRNPFIGHTASAFQVLEAKRDPFEFNIGVHARLAFDVNPIARYADQVSVINMINLPTL